MTLYYDDTTRIEVWSPSTRLWTAIPSDQRTIAQVHHKTLAQLWNEQKLGRTELKSRVRVNGTVVELETHLRLVEPSRASDDLTTLIQQALDESEDDNA